MSDLSVVAPLARGSFFLTRSSRETELHMPVTPSTSDGMRVGQFTLAQATVGLLVMLGVLAYFDKRVL